MPARTPGPIAAPEALLTTLAEYRQLHLALADSEPGHPWLAALELPCELEIDAVARQEEALGASFSDLVLAVLAARVPHLEDAFELALELGPLAAEARAQRCPVDLLAIARAGETFYCVPRREHAWATTTITPWHPEDGTSTPRPLQRWLKEGPIDDLWQHLAELQAIDPGADEPLPPQARPDAASPFGPRLVLAHGVGTAVGQGEHRKFGVGRVLRAIGEGDARKLDIDFGPAGVRTILARFVRELSS
jgi:hypothetical protein